MNARKVDASHSISAEGVRFNVESVEQLGKPLPEADRHVPSYQQGKLETMSSAPSNIVATTGSLMNTALTAFANHYPLTMSPDDIWILLSFAFAKHVDKNAEALRSNFVKHEGKKKLEIQVDHFVLGAMSPEDWEKDVFPGFSRQIRKHIGPSVHDVIASSFSTTTAATQAAHEITLMAAMKNYFSYGMCTASGIPWIELRGIEKDWVTLRERAEKMGDLMTPSFRSSWMEALLPVLDEFISAFRGEVNHVFWQSMIKYIAPPNMSGASPSISGWINVFYPYLSGSLDRENSYIRTWQQLDQFSGPAPESFPSIISSAPVEWIYYESLLPMHFHAGQQGAVQDKDTLALRPIIVWSVTHDPEQKH